MAVLAAPAYASTAGAASGTLTYTADPGETNNLVVTVTSGTATVTDAPDVHITVGAGCTNPENDNTATCSGVTSRYTVSLDDMSDIADMGGVSLPGVSTLSGGDDGDGLGGGPGAGTSMATPAPTS